MPHTDGDDDDRAAFVPLEDVIAAHLSSLFPGMDVVRHATFRVTRNEDLEVEEDDAENLLQALEKELLRRRFGPPVRLELAEGIAEDDADLLLRELGVVPDEVYRLPEPLDLRGLTIMADLDRPELQFPKFLPRTHRDLNEVETAQASNVFAAISRRDVLLHHPYDSFSTSVQAFLEQAAADPHVLAIKQTLYRTSGDSPIVDALIDAAEAGKQVLALVEIKARFDEQANITWARKLEHAGVHVVYGIVGLKTHAKLSLVVRQEPGGLARYCHVGTGNYNPKTARIYEDLGLLTKDPQVADDLTVLFNQLSGFAPRASYKRLLVAPRTVRQGLVDLVEREILNAGRGLPTGIRIKVNSIVDETLIDALYRASGAGVPVDVVVRGICAVRPGVPGLSENIRVRSILGRFLEHSRVFAFVAGGEPGGLHRQRRHDAPQPRPPGRGAGPPRRRAARRSSSCSCSSVDGPGDRLLAPARRRGLGAPRPRRGRLPAQRPAAGPHRRARGPFVAPRQHVAAPPDPGEQRQGGVTERQRGVTLGRRWVTSRHRAVRKVRHLFTSWSPERSGAPSGGP